MTAPRNLMICPNKHQSHAISSNLFLSYKFLHNITKYTISEYNIANLIRTLTMLSSFLTFLLFCIALSADTFTAGLSYGSSGVRIPAPSKLILALVSGLMFTLSVFFSVFLSVHFPEKAVLLLSFLIFFCLSLYKGYDALSFRSRGRCGQKKALAGAFTTDSLSRRINYAKPSVLSVKEAFLLSLVLSLDSLTAGAGYQLNLPPLPVILLLSSAIHLLSLILGLSLSRRLLRKHSCILSLHPALFFLFLALSRLLKFLYS